MKDNEFTGAVYTPSAPGLPLLAIIFKDGELVTWREVSSPKEGEAAVAEALRTLPTLE